MSLPLPSPPDSYSPSHFLLFSISGWLTHQDLKKLYTRPTMSDKELRSRTANHVGLQMPMEGEALAEHNRKKVEKKQAAIEKAALASSQSIGVPEE